MQFQGWWIAGDASEVTITPHVFDETELSESSDWKEAHQNEDATQPHGFIVWNDAMKEAECRLEGSVER